MNSITVTVASSTLTITRTATLEVKCPDTESVTVGGYGSPVILPDTVIVKWTWLHQSKTWHAADIMVHGHRVLKSGKTGKTRHMVRFTTFMKDAREACPQWLADVVTAHAPTDTF